MRNTRFYCICTLLMILLSGCSTAPPPTYKPYELVVIVQSNILYPPVIYEELETTELSTLVTEGERYIDSGTYDKASQVLTKAEFIVHAADGPFSLQLLPIYDKLIMAEYRQGDIISADRLQHRYQQIITANFSKDDAIMRRSQFRIGCWHGFINDWYQALFDFEEVVKSFQDMDTRVMTEEDRSTLSRAEQLADLASIRCCSGEF